MRRRLNIPFKEAQSTEHSLAMVILNRKKAKN